jgi:hypothetical protein
MRNTINAYDASRLCAVYLKSFHARSYTISIFTDTRRRVDIVGVRPRRTRGAALLPFHVHVKLGLAQGYSEKYRPSNDGLASWKDGFEGQCKVAS